METLEICFALQAASGNRRYCRYHQYYKSVVTVRSVSGYYYEELSFLRFLAILIFIIFLKENVLSALLNNDLQRLTTLLAEVAPLGDDGENGKKVPFPLGDDHWINAPCDKEHKNKTLLELAAEKGKLGNEAVKLLLSAGAAADLYNEKTGRAAIHVAVANGDLETVETLLDMLTQKPKINRYALLPINNVIINAFIKSYVCCRANINGFNKDGQTVLHIAAESGDVRMLAFLVDRRDLDDLDPKDLKGQRTPLYLAAKAKQAAACELLISRGADLSHRCFGKTVRDHLKDSMPYLDLNKIKVSAGEKWATKTRLDVCGRLSELLDYAARNARRGLSNAHNLLQFKIYLSMKESAELDRYDAGGLGLFQKACKDGLAEHVEEMLKVGMDPNAVAEESSSQPLLLAAFEGYHQVLRVLEQDSERKKADKSGGKVTNFAAVERQGGESALTWVLANRNHNTYQYSDPRSNYGESLKVLMSPAIKKTVGKLVNLKDNQGNTPLHFAALLWDQKTVRTLLELGANIGIKNLYDEVAVTYIAPETLESFLDEFCISSKNEVTNEDLEITYNYSFLAPPPLNNKITNEDNLEDQKGNSHTNPALPETEVLWYMSQSDRHRYLLKHPVINSFLWLKWHKIEGFVNRNLRLYFLFVMILSWYVFERFGGVQARSTVSKGGLPYCSPLSTRSEMTLGFWFYAFVVHILFQAMLLVRDWRRGCYHVTCGATKLTNLCLCTLFEAFMVAMLALIIWKRTSALWTVLTILQVVLIAREFFQMTGSLKRYICSPENWLEMFMLSLVGLVLWLPDSAYGDDNCSVKRHLSGVAVMLAWVEFVTLVARHPRLTSYNIYVTMFYRVMTTFFTFLLWYCFFVLSFGLGFYIMLHRDTPGRQPNQDEYKFFNYPWLTLIKTSTMFVGELEFGDLPIDSDEPMSWLAYLFLLAFVFLIVVVLMNLLNGLAVSDTGIIRDQAEIVSSVSRVETISYVESLLLGDPFDFLSNWPPFSLIKTLPSLACSRFLYRNKAVKDLSLCVTGATGLLLFYSTLPDKTLTIRPNRRSSSCIAVTEMDERIVSASKKLISEKQTRVDTSDDGSNEDLLARMESLEEKFDKIMKALKIE